MGWLEDVAENLEDDAVGTVGTSIFAGFLPDSPDSAIAVYDAGGSQIPHGHECPWAEHRLEVRVRAASDSSALTLAASVLASLGWKMKETWNGSLQVIWCEPEDTFSRLEVDQRRRVTYIGRFTVQARRAGKYI
jgi:hypothetical protein